MVWVSAILLFFVGSFGFWRQIRDEYKEEEILSLSVLLGFSAWLGVVVWGVWAGVVSIMFVIMFWARRNKWDGWELFDKLGAIFLGCGGVIWLMVGNWPKSAMWLISFIFIKVLGTRYRSFRWYKSGKLGFVGLISLVVVALSEVFIAKHQVGDLYWAGLSISQWIGVWVAVGAATAIYIRGDRKVSEDFNKIWQRKIK